MCARPVLATTFVLGATVMVFAQSLPARPQAGPRCAFERADAPGYLAWICDPEGLAYSGEALVFHVRKTRSGGDVASRIWAGSLRELAVRLDTIIEAHRRETAHCALYFHVARDADTDLAWDRPTDTMRRWWDLEGRRQFGDFCYTIEPGDADFVIVWSESDAGRSRSFSRLPQARDQIGARPRRRAGAEPPLSSLEPDPPIDVVLRVYPVSVTPIGPRLDVPVLWVDGRDSTLRTPDQADALAGALSLVARQP